MPKWIPGHKLRALDKKHIFTVPSFNFKGCQDWNLQYSPLWEEAEIALSVAAKRRCDNQHFHAFQARFFEAPRSAVNPGYPIHQCCAPRESPRAPYIYMAKRLGESVI